MTCDQTRLLQNPGRMSLYCVYSCNAYEELHKVTFYEHVRMFVYTFLDISIITHNISIYHPYLIIFKLVHWKSLVCRLKRCNSSNCILAFHFVTASKTRAACGGISITCQGWRWIRGTIGEAARRVGLESPDCPKVMDPEIRNPCVDFFTRKRWLFVQLDGMLGSWILRHIRHIIAVHPTMIILNLHQCQKDGWLLIARKNTSVMGQQQDLKGEGTGVVDNG